MSWVSSYLTNPLDLPVAEKAALLIDWTDRLRQGAAVDHASAYLQQVQENKYYADLTGTRTTQQRVRMQPGFEAMGAGAGQHERLALVDLQPGGPRGRAGKPAGERARIVVAHAHVGARARGDDVQLTQAGDHGARGERRDIRRAGAHARVVGDHRPVALDRHHHRDRGARAARADDEDALLGEHLLDHVPGGVLAQRRRDRGGQTQPGRADRADRPAAGGAHEIAREALLAQPGQAFQTDEGHVEEGGDRHDHFDAHGARLSGSAEVGARIGRMVSGRSLPRACPRRR